MSSLRPQDRVSLCRFTFSDGRRCRTPRTGKHPHFCCLHARKQSQARSADKLSRDLAYFFSGEYLSANDLSAALGLLLPAVVRGDIKPRAASTAAYLAQTLVQTLHFAQDEYIKAFGTLAWRNAIRNSVNQNSAHFDPQPTPEPKPKPNPGPADVPQPALSEAPSSSPSATPLDATLMQTS
jgi:hypothetical protein